MKRCSCGNVAVHQWPLRLCSDGRIKRVLHLCALCDIALNLHMLRLLGDPQAGAKAADYAGEWFAATARTTTTGE